MQLRISGTIKITFSQKLLHIEI